MVLVLGGRLLIGGRDYKKNVNYTCKNLGIEDGDLKIGDLGIWVTKQEDVTAEKESNKANKYLTATCGFNQAKMKKHKKTIHHIYPPNIGILQKGMEDEGCLITKNQISPTTTKRNYDVMNPAKNSDWGFFVVP